MISSMMPKLCMANDVVIQIGEIAEQMFFIYKGTAVVFATDNSTVIAYLNEGSYFGEIGVLITKIRTVTVKAFTLCIFYVIHKNDLLRILELYPDQMEFLQAVGRQRMLTTNLEDIIDDFENNALDANEEKLLSNSNCYNSNNRSMNIAKEKIKCNMTLEFPKSKNFIIIPFSKLYYIWNSIIVILLMYELLFIPFSISFEYEFNIFTLLFDILCKFIFAFDIFMASKTGFNNKFEITVDLKEISKDYIETRLILDALCIIPLDLIIRIFVENDQSVAFCRIIQLIKIYKLYDYLTIWRKYYLGKRNFWYIFFMVFVFIYLAHLNACIFYFIGKIEVDRHDRFDGQCLFSDIINRNFLTLSPVLEMSLLEKYCHFMYLGACTVGGTIYGDIIPYAMSEQLFNQVTTFLSRIVVAFIYAQASGYISSIYMMYSNHIESKSMLIEYLEIHNMPSDMKKRVNKYYEILWNNFKGINDREIMIDIPENINKEIKLFVFTSFIEKFTIFPKEENAAITSLLTRIKISLVPKGEYIIREREIRDCIYFIIRGSVLIISGEIILATLEQGAIFGEMAIAEKIPTVRNASAFCVTHSCIGSCSIDDYNIICHSYPSFEEEIQNEIQRRKIANLTKTLNIKQKSSTNILPNIEHKNKENKLELNFKTSKDSSEFSNIESSQAILKAEEEKQDSKIEENFIQLNQQPLYLKRKETESNSKENQNEEIISKTLKISENDERHFPNLKNTCIKNIIEESKDDLHEEEKESNNIQDQKEKVVIKFDLNEILKIKVSAKIKWKYTFDNIKRTILILLQLYNLVFIPIQGAYRTRFSSVFITLEILTLIFYSIDFAKISLSKVSSESALNSNIILNPTETEKKKINVLKVHFVLSFICCIPFALIFSFANIDDPLLIIYFVKLTRLLKIWPIRRFFNYCKRYYLNMTRIIEMLFMYYVAIHIFSCSLICLAYNESDIRTTWLKRLPVPQPTGVRQYADRTGLSDVSIYCHAFNFAVNTLSHVATGEVSMITYQERIYCAFIILFSTFMYAFLFGNIASIVSELASQKMYFKFHKRYESVMSSLKVDVVPKRIILSIKDYFDFIWLSTHGVPINELSSKLPSCINIDILAARYSKAIQNCVLFKNASNEIDLPFTNSFLTFLNFRVYMDGDFIVIGGSHSRNTYIMMEGEAGVFSFRDEFISLMKTGSYYSNDLDSDDEDTFQYKRPVHIVSKGTSIVGVLTIEMLNELYLAYPEFKCIMRSLNRHFNLYAKKFLMKYLKSMNIIHSKSSLINQMIEHFSYSTSEKYDNIRNKLNTIDFTEREISKYDIKIKQMNRTEIIERNLTLHDHRRENNLENEYEPKAQEINQNCLSWLQFSKHSTFIQIFDAIHLFNLLYIVTSIPLMIGFNIKMTTSFFVLEIVSILISLITIIINFRVQVIKRYGPTINLKDVLIYYFNNGLIFDLFGLWPLNLVLGIPNFTQPFWLIFPLRIIRCICCIRIYSIIRKFEISYQRYGLLINILKACLFVCIAWHFIACSWSFVNIYMERGNKTWIEYQELDNSPLYKQILYCYFNILNTVTTIGYTNFAPVTDIERIFIALTINSGDAIFAVGFGLLAGIVTQSSIYGRSEVFFSKMNSIKELLKERNCDEAQIKKVEQYFAFLWYSQNKSSDIMIIKELSEQLPHKLSKEVVYHCTKELLEPMFKKFGSENLIKDLSAVLKQTIYLPGDFIILKGDIGEEMYFIVEGTINILAADKRTVLNTLVKGSYFGEMAIFLDSNKRTAYVQAESFCNILILYKKDVDIIKEDYPSVAEDIKKETRKRYFETHNIEEDNDIVIRESDVSHSQINSSDQLNSKSNPIWIKEESKDNRIQESRHFQNYQFDQNEEDFDYNNCLTDRELNFEDKYKLPAYSEALRTSIRAFTVEEESKAVTLNPEKIIIELPTLDINRSKRLSDNCNYSSSIKTCTNEDNNTNKIDSNRSVESCEDNSILENPIMQMINCIDAERRMQSNHSNQMDDASSSEYSKISQFRRRGPFKERRLSRIDLGKQLAFTKRY